METFFFAFVVVCFFNSLVSTTRIWHDQSRFANSNIQIDMILLNAAMALTIAADYFMLVRYDNLTGLCFFCAVQTTYHIRYIRHIRYTPVKQVARIIIQIMACVIVIILPLNNPALTMGKMACAYAICLLFSVYAACLSAKKCRTRNSIIAATGMLLFLLCDLCVGLYNLTPGYGTQNIFYCLTWFFYLPSQALLSVS